MVKNILENIAGDFETIQVLGDASWAETEFTDMLNIQEEYIKRIDRQSFMYNGGLLCDSTDLLVINIDAFGQADAQYLLFLHQAFKPRAAVVLITGDVLTERTREYFLSSGALEVIHLIGRSKVNVTDLVG